MLENEYRLEIQFKKVRILVTFQWSGPDHWNVGLRRTYAKNGLYMVFNIYELCCFNFLPKTCFLL